VGALQRVTLWDEQRTSGGAIARSRQLQEALTNLCGSALH